MASKQDGGCLVVYTRCEPGRDDEFNKWYDEIHVGEVLALPGMTACQRFKLSDSQMMPDHKFRYMAIYEFDCSPAEALKAMGEGAGGFNMSEDLEAPYMAIYEPLGDRVLSK